MRWKTFAWLLPLVAVSSLPLKADTQDSVWVNGSYSSLSHGVAIGPYGGTLNGTPTQFFCVDYNSPIYANTGWNAFVTGLTSPTGYGKTLLQSQTTYLEMAWLITKMMNPSNTQVVDAQLQWAIWYLSLTKSQQNPRFPNYQTDLKWDSLAYNAVMSGFTVTGWEILTPTGGYGQEFIVPGAAVPEPSALVLLCISLIVLVVVFRRNRTSRVNTTTVMDG